MKFCADCMVHCVYIMSTANRIYQLEYLNASQLYHIHQFKSIKKKLIEVLAPLGCHAALIGS
jgi:hypothetical protein